MSQSNMEQWCAGFNSALEKAGINKEAADDLRLAVMLVAAEEANGLSKEAGMGADIWDFVKNKFNSFNQGDWGTKFKKLRGFLGDAYGNYKWGDNWWKGPLAGAGGGIITALGQQAMTGERPNWGMHLGGGALLGLLGSPVLNKLQTQFTNYSKQKQQTAAK